MAEINEGVVAPESNEGEGSVAQDETVSIPKKDYETLNQTLGSLKRELKDLKKAKEEPKETPTTNQPKSDDVLLQRVEKLAIKTAGIDHPDDVELARNTAKKWGMDIEEVLADDDFKAKLEKQQTSRANIEATSGVRGSGSAPTQAKLTAEYWQAKGTPPSPTDVPDAAKRREIIRGMMNASKGNGKMKFYNS
jgi:hypothetical protein